MAQEKIHNRRDDTYEVQDRPTENGIKINNIISFLILGVMGWVGYNIEAIKVHVANVTTVTAVNKTDIENLKTGFIEHKRNHHKED